MIKYILFLFLILLFNCTFSQTTDWSIITDDINKSLNQEIRNREALKIQLDNLTKSNIQTIANNNATYNNKNIQIIYNNIKYICANELMKYNQLLKNNQLKFSDYELANNGCMTQFYSAIIYCNSIDTKIKFIDNKNKETKINTMLNDFILRSNIYFNTKIGVNKKLISQTIEVKLDNYNTYLFNEFIDKIKTTIDNIE